MGGSGDGGGIDLTDSFDRMFNTGNYSNFKDTTGIDRFNPIGQDFHTWNLNSFANPLGSENDQVAATLNTGDTAGAWTQFNQDNSFGRNTTFEKQQQGWSRGESLNAGSQTTGNSAMSIAALIFGGAAAAGGSGSTAAGGSTATTGAAGGGTVAGSGTTATTGTTGASSFDWSGLAKKGISQLSSSGGGGSSGGQQQSYQQYDPSMQNYYSNLNQQNAQYGQQYNRGYY